MAKLKFKDENNNFIPVVQDVKVNKNSVFDGKDANINIKTINNQPVVGNGNIVIDQDFVKDNNYVHTDNNFSNEYKNKLDGLENYDDTEIKDDIANLNTNKADKSEIPDVSNFITRSVNDLLNYYKKTETFTKQEVNDLISAISTLTLEVVQTLPTEDISTTTIYLVPKTTAETNDIYDEYIYVSNAWEHIGSTQADLSNYYTKTQVDGKVDFYDGSTTYTTVQSTIERLITDFQGALDEKAYVTDVVDKTSAQTITGSKTFNEKIVANNIGTAYSTEIFNIKAGTSALLSVGSGTSIIRSNLVSNPSYNLGSSSYKWNNLYLSGNLTDGTNSVAVNKIANKDNFVTLSQSDYDGLVDGGTVDSDTYYFIEEE